MTAEAVARPSSGTRVAALDGLRGLVILSVVVNHAGGVLWPRGEAYDVPVLRGLLGGGAVVVFFVVGAFIVARGLLRDRERATLDPMRFYLRRIVRLGAQLVLVCAAVWVAAHFDPTDEVSDRVMAHNVFHVLSYTFNIFGERDFFEVQREFGHLWYLSVQQQCYLVLPLVIVLLGRVRWALFGLLVMLVGLVFWWRQEVLDDRGWVIASSLTSTRADGLIWGVAVAVALPWLHRVRVWPRILWVSCLVLVTLKLVLPELPTFAYLGPWSLAFTAVAGVVVVAIWQLEQPTRVSRMLSWRPLQVMGKASLAIFVWHLPVIIIVQRHTADWSWPARTALAFAVIAAITVVVERWVDDPIRHLLATRPVFRLGRPTSPGVPLPESTP
ncbi:MAG: acyltransferase [Aeromicrobium sp.]